MPDPASRSDLVPGTLEMLILKTLLRGAQHGYGIAQRIDEASGGVLHVEEGSLYPALQRMLMKGWVTAEWSQTELNRKARFYKLTPPGKKQLSIEVEEFRRVTRAIESILQPGDA
jgi:PadR family transcriptional regulator, regulatory protein PadR